MSGRWLLDGNMWNCLPACFLPNSKKYTAVVWLQSHCNNCSACTCLDTPWYPAITPTILSSRTAVRYLDCHLTGFSSPSMIQGCCRSCFTVILFFGSVCNIVWSSSRDPWDNQEGFSYCPDWIFLYKDEIFSSSKGRNPHRRAYSKTPMDQMSASDPDRVEQLQGSLGQPGGLLVLP